MISSFLVFVSPPGARGVLFCVFPVLAFYFADGIALGLTRPLARLCNSNTRQAWADQELAEGAFPGRRAPRCAATL